MAKSKNRVTVYLDELTKKKFIKRTIDEKRTESQMASVIIYDAVKDVKL